MLSVHDVRQLEAANRQRCLPGESDWVTVEAFAEALGITVNQIWGLRHGKSKGFPDAVRRRVGAQNKLQWPRHVVEAYVSTWRARKAAQAEATWARKAEDQRRRRKPKEDLRGKTPARGPMLARIFKANRVAEAGMYYAIYSEIESERDETMRMPLSVSEHYVARWRPWSMVRVGQGFFVPGVRYEKLRSDHGRFASQCGFLDGVPGVMVWRVE